MRKWIARAILFVMFGTPVGLFLWGNYVMVTGWQQFLDRIHTGTNTWGDALTGIADTIVLIIVAAALIITLPQWGSWLWDNAELGRNPNNRA